MRIVFPHRSLMRAPVTAGTVDATYERDWLTLAMPDHPIKATNPSLTIAPLAPVLCDVFCVHHHDIAAGATISLGGSVTNTIPTAAWPGNGIPNNWFRRLASPVSVSSLVLGVTGDSGASIIGGLYAGLSMEITSGFRHGRSFDPGQPFPWEGEYALIAPPDLGVARPRRYQGEFLFNPTEFAEFVDGELSMRNGSRPCLIILEDSVNDAMLAVFSYTDSTDGHNHIVSIQIVEVPRVEQ